MSWPFLGEEVSRVYTNLYTFTLPLRWYAIIVFPNPISSFHPCINNCLYLIYKPAMKLILDEKNSSKSHQVIIIINIAEALMDPSGAAWVLYFKPTLFAWWIIINIAKALCSLKLHILACLFMLLQLKSSWVFPFDMVLNLYHFNTLVPQPSQMIFFKLFFHFLSSFLAKWGFALI